MIPRLADVLKDEHRDGASLNAVNLLVEYAPTDLSLLASLLTVAEPAELSILVEAIAASGDAGRDAVEREWLRIAAEESATIDVSQPWGSPWWCAGDRTPIQVDASQPIADSLQERLLAFESVIGPHAIITHKLPQAELDPVSEGVKASGYRIGDLTPYMISGESVLRCPVDPRRN